MLKILSGLLKISISLSSNVPTSLNHDLIFIEKINIISDWVLYYEKTVLFLYKLSSPTVLYYVSNLICQQGNEPLLNSVPNQLILAYSQLLKVKFFLHSKYLPQKQDTNASSTASSPLVRFSVSL